MNLMNIIDFDVMGGGKGGEALLAILALFGILIVFILAIGIASTVVLIILIKKKKNLERNAVASQQTPPTGSV